MSSNRQIRALFAVLMIFTVAFLAVFLPNQRDSSRYFQFGFKDKVKSEVPTTLPNISSSLQRFLPRITLPYNEEYVMVSGTDFPGLGDITSYKPITNISDVISKCDEMQSLCKAFSFIENIGKHKPGYAYLKQSFGIPSPSSLNLYIKRKYLHLYLSILSVNLKCPLANVSEDLNSCKLPVLDPYAKEIAHLVPTQTPIKCDEKQLYTALENNILKIRESKLNDSNLLQTEAQPIHRPNGTTASNDHSFHLGEPHILINNTSNFSIEEDLWKVTTKLKNGHTFTTYHMSVVEKQKVLSRMPSNDAPLDIIIIELDGTSEAHFRRMLPMTYAFLRDELGSYMFKGYSVVGDATLPNVNAMLTGNTVEENKELHHDDENVDNWPLLFKDLKKNGFVTMWSEDFAALGTYTLTLPGFKEQPTDHYPRPLWLSGALGMCLGGQFQVKVQLDYLRSFMKSYPRQRKFGLTFLCDLCHRALNLVSGADLEMLSFLKSLKTEKMLNESMFVMMSDHGARFGEIRSTHQGKLEERLPFLSITLPTWFKEKFPEKVANLQSNTKIITSPYDLHSTFLQLLSFSKPSAKTKRGTSLFEALPENRTCRNASIPDQWCPCLEWHPVDPTHAHIVGSAHHAVLSMNQNLAKHELSSALCERITLKRIRNAVQKISTNNRVNGRYDRCSYQLQIETMPGDARFEVFVEVMNTGEYKVHGAVSRINAYGTQAKCIESKVPSVRKYCYCR